MPKARGDAEHCPGSQIMLSKSDPLSSRIMVNPAYVEPGFTMPFQWSLLRYVRALSPPEREVRCTVRVALGTPPPPPGPPPIFRLSIYVQRMPPSNPRVAGSLRLP